MVRERWEYLLEVVPERRFKEQLDELGGVGWELVTARWEEHHWGGQTQLQVRCILKRSHEPSELYGARSATPAGAPF